MSRELERNQEATCYVGNLDDRVTDPLLWELMYQAGPLAHIFMPKDRVTQLHQGFAFAEYHTPADAEYATAILNGIKMFGKPIRVNIASGGDTKQQLDIGANLFVGNLDPEVKERTLYDTFSAFGNILGYPKIARDPTTNESKGYGFVSFDAFDVSDAAIEALNNQFLMNRPMTVMYALKQDTKHGERHDDTIVRPDPLPWYLILTGWTCESNCEYHCTHRITNEARKRVHDIHESVWAALRIEQEQLAETHLRWQAQKSYEKQAEEFGEYCGDAAYMNSDGVCIARIFHAPPPLKSEYELRILAEATIRAALARLSVPERRPVQYYGKWAQIRILGMQEPLSVLFSLMNLGVQVYGARLIVEHVPDTFPIKSLYLLHTYLASTAWVASAIFHTRDAWWTERLDYFCAAAMLLSGLFFSVCRVYFIQPGSDLYRRWMCGCLVAYGLHVFYLMLHKRLDYSYNMVACLAVGVAHNLVWLAAALAPRMVNLVFSQLRGMVGSVHVVHEVKEQRLRLKNLALWNASAIARTPRTFDLVPQQRSRLVSLALLMFVAPALELFDFPPVLRILDAHALWHLSTVPISIVWYQWLVMDARTCVTSYSWSLDAHYDMATDVDELRSSTDAELPSTAYAKAPQLLETAITAASNVQHTSNFLSNSTQHLLRTLTLWGRSVMRILHSMLVAPQ
ncbi:Spliceosome-associated protein 49 [Malassezia vespertilionis]|uniref:Spliceosome-associated protein 49 n=1 Tax=Malassezia vespertilionis TaxID=2020962 RepID=UPI0024B061F3|nr:Spliceosome-associated protein 49 [Malassezia vespertilionis]WFD05381.1 Spliceosome-associated protein 49 [Malassezia vespertilionis]